MVVGLERGPPTLVSTIEELLGKNSCGTGLEIQEYGREDPPRWLRGTPLSATVGTNFAYKRRLVGRKQKYTNWISAYFCLGTPALQHCLHGCEHKAKNSEFEPEGLLLTKLCWAGGLMQNVLCSVVMWSPHGTTVKRRFSLFREGLSIYLSQSNSRVRWILAIPIQCWPFPRLSDVVCADSGPLGSAGLRSWILNSVKCRSQNNWTGIQKTPHWKTSDMLLLISERSCFEIDVTEMGELWGVYRK
jgi:hypothetical protein